MKVDASVCPQRPSRNCVGCNGAFRHATFSESISTEGYRYHLQPILPVSMLEEYGKRCPASTH
ncbi:hypothetical protein E2C01_066122 [Portunus trituberculatus]|uniref:Uncharacterized protein n=1 Tax=Portunus trituberculatus TaxID=210409 RepID=A0A5B7HKN3_PORTR|nr:hypothetical protein [Portunus trituberculatus]